MNGVIPSPAGRARESAREDITVRLIRHFKNLIREGRMKPGCRLAPERELAQALKVNRASLRQALKVLQVMGILRQRVGDGTYLSGDPRGVFREPLEFLILMTGISNRELFELRLLVEPEMAATAAARAATEDLARMLVALDALEKSGSTAERTEADLALHEAIFRAAGNRLCLFVFTVIQRAVLESMEQSAQRLEIGETLREHRAIYEAIQKGDAAAARRTMAAHLRNSWRSLKPLEGRPGTRLAKASGKRP